MNSSVYGDPVPPRKDRREQAREKARQELAKAKKQEQRSKWLWRGGITVGLIAIVTVVALIIVGGMKPSSADGPLNMASDGILLTGDGTTVSVVPTAARPANEAPVASDLSKFPNTVSIITYVDYLCPYCGEFEDTNAAQITQWVTAGNATLEVHPISILNSASQGTEYSTRSANAAACVANYDPSKFLAVSTALFANQPKENTAGLPDTELVKLVEDAGATDSQISSCITGGMFTAWVTDATDRALTGPLPNANIPKVEGTPTVLVNGVAYTGSYTDAAAFQAFVMQQASSTGSATPAPSDPPSTPSSSSSPSQ